MSSSSLFRQFIPSEAPSRYTFKSWDEQFENDMKNHQDLEQWESYLGKVSDDVLKKELKKIQNSLNQKKSRKKRIQIGSYEYGTLNLFKEKIEKELKKRENGLFQKIASILKKYFGHEIGQIVGKIQKQIKEQKLNKSNKSHIIKLIQDEFKKLEIRKKIKAYISQKTHLPTTQTNKVENTTHFMMAESEFSVFEMVHEEGGPLGFLIAGILSILIVIIYCLSIKMQLENWNDTLINMGVSPQISHIIAAILID